MAKYDPLFEYLCRAPDGPLMVSFTALDQIVGGLPASARTYSAWWANEGGGSRHVQAKAWLNAGRRVEHVDRQSGVIHFSAARW